MTQESLKNSSTTSADESCTYLNAEKPTIRILLYTDDPTIVKDSDKEIDPLSIGKMKKHLETHSPAFAKIDPVLLSRNSAVGHLPDHKLDVALAKETYDQIWFFGIHQVNKPKFKLGLKGGGPQSELDENEVKELKKWMSEDGMRGGVLVTGDHANPHPDAEIPHSKNKFCPEGFDHEKFLSLGRALGKFVPRAGLLRQWEGPPTLCVEDRFNTQVLSFGTDLEFPGLEIDATPQELILQTFDANGKPAQNGQPHPLFIGRRGQWIQVFPDHTHEGAVVLPCDFDDEEVWPKRHGMQPVPRVVAYGLDKRTRRLLKIVAAYNGDSVGVGRVVADSTWHHYFNTNLTNFPPVSEDGSAADQIGQYYRNLAVWLSPLDVRLKMAHAMFSYLANHPLMVEEAGNGVLNIGRTAYRILSQMASACEIHELLQVARPRALRQKFEMLYFPESESVFSHLPSKELILGSVVNQYHQEITRRFGPEDSETRRATDFCEVMEEGFAQAFLAQAETIEELNDQASEILKVLNL